IRAVEDYHVDRPGVEVRQRMQLTGTNSSIDLITPIYNIHQAKLDDLYRSRQSGFARRLRGRAGKPAACSRMLIVYQRSIRALMLSARKTEKAQEGRS